eukprot:5470643-Alexandrium_andersonii.AAC.1
MERLVLPGGHQAFFFPESSGWGVAIVINQKWSSGIGRFKGEEGVGMVEVCSTQKWVFIAAHLPHSWGPNSPEREFREELWALKLDRIRSYWKQDRSVLGLDANARIGGFSIEGVAGGEG